MAQRGVSVLRGNAIVAARGEHLDEEAQAERIVVGDEDQGLVHTARATMTMRQNGRRCRIRQCQSRQQGLPGLSPCSPWPLRATPERAR